MGGETQKERHALRRVFLFGGRYRIRTYDLPHVKRMLVPAELIVRRAKSIISMKVLFVNCFFKKI